MNLFQNILNKSTQFWQNFSLQWVAKLWQKVEDKYNLSEKAFNYAQPEAQDPIQRYLDDPSKSNEGKQNLMDNLKAGIPKEVLQSYITETVYKPKEFSQMYGSTAPTFQYSSQDNPITTAGKFLLNIPSSAKNLTQQTMNLGRTAKEQGFGETANMIGRGLVRGIGEWAQAVQTEYNEGGTLWVVNTSLQWVNKYLTQNPAEILAPSAIKPMGNLIKSWGKGIMQWAEAVAPKTVAIIKKPVTIVKNKAIDIFWKEQRPVQDIAGNILQPYKWMVENLDDATNWLRRVVDETWVETDTFEWLLWKIEETQAKYGQMKQESLWQITQTQKSVSAQKALENLDNVYANVSSKEMLATQARIKELARKNRNEWLTPLEMDEVKILHTKANNLFNEKGQQTGGFSSDDLRWIRRDLKEEIEVFAEQNGVSNIREINKAYGELSDARTLAQNQVDNLRSYKGRQIPPTRLRKVADFIMEFPVVKQAFSDPARILTSSLFKTLRGDKINPIEVQRRLPGFLKELQDAGMKAWDLQKVEKMIQSEIKLLPARTQSTIQPRAIPLGKSQAEIIAESKKWLPSNISRNANNNNNRTLAPSNSTEVKPSTKPIVKNLQKTEKSATIGDMETKKLIEEAKTLWKYDNSYDVVNWKKLYRWWNEDWVFWTDDIDIAKSFWDEWAIEKTITIKKPLDVRSKWIRDYIKKNTDIKIDDATSAYSRSLPEFKKLMKWAKDNWYDWIIGKTSDNWLNFTGNEFVVIK